jgi:hypothetical protein
MVSGSCASPQRWYHQPGAFSGEVETGSPLENATTKQELERCGAALHDGWVGLPNECTVDVRGHVEDMLSACAAPRRWRFAAMERESCLAWIVATMAARAASCRRRANNKAASPSSTRGPYPRPAAPLPEPCRMHGNGDSAPLFDPLRTPVRDPGTLRLSRRARRQRPASEGTCPPRSRSKRQSGGSHGRAQIEPEPNPESPRQGGP